MIRFGVVGAGWRSEFYIRIADALPYIFDFAGIYIRNPKTAQKFSKKYNVNICSSLDELLDLKPDFVVSCVNKASMCDEVKLLCEKGVAVLSETPIGASNEQTDRFLAEFNPSWRVQVAEQFHLQPRNQAIKAIIDSGIIGEVSHVNLACCHDYHAVSLIRHFLRINNQLPQVKQVEFGQNLCVYNSRSGYISPAEKTATHTLAFLDYTSKTALYDFIKEQYFSDIRRSRIVIQGDKGEIVDDTCTYLKDGRVHSFTLSRLCRGADGNLDGLYLDRITAEGKVLYENPFYKARLTDEEIAIAHCLVKMAEYLKSGTEFYSVQEAALDAKTAFLFHNEV
ncbi:MAG: Gfo/Idh/MocA family oxidoreductase [Clostridia bacterium]|nr:Gfo/Idh/MocA family oxidoreductase [Clostridia bacterium]